MYRQSLFSISFAIYQHIWWGHGLAKWLKCPLSHYILINECFYSNTIPLCGKICRLCQENFQISHSDLRCLHSWYEWMKHTDNTWFLYLINKVKLPVPNVNNKGHTIVLLWIFDTTFSFWAPWHLHLIREYYQRYHCVKCVFSFVKTEISKMRWLRND